MNDEATRIRRQVRVSYQKLLKCFVLNELHKKPPKGLKKKFLFRTLKQVSSAAAP